MIELLTLEQAAALIWPDEDTDRRLYKIRYWVYGARQFRLVAVHKMATHGQGGRLLFDEETVRAFKVRYEGWKDGNGTSSSPETAEI